MLMRKIIEKVDQTEKEAYKDLDNKEKLKAYVKAAKAGVIEGFADGALLAGLIYATIGISYSICEIAKIKVE